MKKYLDEFKEFINKGDVITIAVGLVMALVLQGDRRRRSWTA